MEEPKKIVRCHYLGTTVVHRPTGFALISMHLLRSVVGLNPLPFLFIYYKIVQEVHDTCEQYILQNDAKIIKVGY